MLPILSASLTQLLWGEDLSEQGETKNPATTGGALCDLPTLGYSSPPSLHLQSFPSELSSSTSPCRVEVNDVSVGS